MLESEELYTRKAGEEITTQARRGGKHAGGTDNSYVAVLTLSAPAEPQATTNSTAALQLRG